jgi:cadmium resistance protein CadD (predicted permease)
MKKFRVGLIVGATILILGELAIIDYSNLTGSKNLGAYLGIIGMICTISILILSIKQDKKKQANLTDKSR